ncbi:MAG: dinitrogenase iron-molybdenum cofactor biosynthesis protein, partial [Chloroflexi bacterium]|nr:dinitrogenase iron-molybdenum cofactor biosynthesis protein [Chloroflexota bacterium]
MKIACVTDDERTISPHFGRALYYVVLTIENGQVTARERRDKLNHQHFAAGEHPGPSGAPHGFDAASQDRHSSMAAAIADCQVLLGRGMGFGAHSSLAQLGITPIITDIADIDGAVTAYLNGSLVD